MAYILSYQNQFTNQKQYDKANGCRAHHSGETNRFISEIKETKDINDVKYMCFLSLFSQDLFYITHQLISDFFKNNEININLINKLKQKHLKFDE